MEPTSVDSYKTLTRQFFSEWHNMILDVMFSRPGKRDWTRREVHLAIIDQGLIPADKCLSSTVSARIHELINKWGLLVENDGKRICEVSGHWVKSFYPSMTDYRDYQDAQMAEELDKDPFKDLFG